VEEIVVSAGSVRVGIASCASAGGEANTTARTRARREERRRGMGGVLRGSGVWVLT
jgi:hypothetical protein